MSWGLLEWRNRFWSPCVSKYNPKYILMVVGFPQKMLNVLRKTFKTPLIIFKKKTLKLDNNVLSRQITVNIPRFSSLCRPKYILVCKQTLIDASTDVMTTKVCYLNFFDYVF